MKTLFLLRHGQSQANVEGLFSARLRDVQLSQAGKQQALAWCNVLPSWLPQAVYVSPATRAQQTAQLVLDQLELNPVTTHHLLEVDVGRLDNQPVQGDIWAQYEEVRKAWEAGDHHVSLPGGESLEEIRERLELLLQDIQREDAERVLLVAHAMIFMVMIWIYGNRHRGLLQEGYMDCGQMSVLIGMPNNYELSQFNLPPQPMPF